MSSYASKAGTILALKNTGLTARKIFRQGKESWFVDIPLRLVGKRVRIFRNTEREAIAAANEYVAEHQTHGEDLANISLPERAFILWLREAAITVEVAKRLISETPTGSGKILKKGILEYLKGQKGNDKHHIYSLRSKLSRLEEAFSGRTVASIRPGEIEIFLRDKGRSKLSYYRVLRAFFNFAVMHDWTEVNPVLKVPRPALAPDERVIFSAEEMARLLAAAQEVGSLPMLRLLVLGGFFGLRYKEIHTLQAEDVGVEEIFVRKMKTQKKGMRERYVTTLPNAKAWLPLLKLPKKGPALGVNDKNLRINRDKVLAKANEGHEDKIEWPYNVLRRSYGSYHLAAFENPGQTAAQMGHTDPETTVGKYRAVRKKADGEAWFAITPKSVWGESSPEPPQNEKFRPWTKEEEARLGTAPDRDVAAAINRTLYATRARRASLGIPAFKP